MRGTGWVGCTLRHGCRASTGAALLVAALASVLASRPAHALVIDPTFGSGTNSTIDAAINSAISTIDGLYSNNVTVDVTFTASNAGATYLLQTSQSYYETSYSAYLGQLQADSTANPSNGVLSTALAHLSDGNGATSPSLALTGAVYNMLGLAGAPVSTDATININTYYGFNFSNSGTTFSQYDAVGGYEHELDEVLGGGGGGSTLNFTSDCPTPGDGFCGLLGDTDLDRYSGPGVGSYSESSSVTSYLSVDGGTTQIVDFNQVLGNGDMGDFVPPCGPSSGNSGNDQYIQNAQNCTGQYEAYTTSSPEYEMMEAIGWNPTHSSPPVPEPGTLALLASSLLGLGLVRRRRA